MARETELKMRTVKVNPFKKGCNRMPNESNKKAALNGIPTNAPLFITIKTAINTNKNIEANKQILKSFFILISIVKREWFIFPKMKKLSCGNIENNYC